MLNAMVIVLEQYVKDASLGDKVSLLWAWRVASVDDLFSKSTTHLYEYSSSLYSLKFVNTYCSELEHPQDILIGRAGHLTHFSALIGFYVQLTT